MSQAIDVFEDVDTNMEPRFGEPASQTSSMTFGGIRDPLAAHVDGGAGAATEVEGGSDVFEPRKRLADIRNDPSKRARRARKVEGATAAEQEVERKLRQLDHEARWQAFLFFLSFQYLSILHAVYGTNLSTDTYDYTYGRAQVMDNIKAYKCKVLDRMERHVRLLLEDNPICKSYTTNVLLQQFFTTTFNSANFFYVWHYMDGYLNVEGSSTLGRYYIKSIYVNLAMETKKYVDLKDTDEGREEPIARKALLQFYDYLPISPDFAQVTRREFREVMERSRNEKKGRKKWDSSGLNRIVSLGAPPPPRSTVESADGNASVNGVDGGLATTAGN